MKGFDRFLKSFLFLFLAGFLTGAATLPLSAQVTIPQGSVVTNAVFSVYGVSVWRDMTFNLFRITKDWGESSVTWANFHPGTDPTLVGSFTVTASSGNTVSGWYSVNIATLVQGWVNGTYPNFGIAVRQVPTQCWNYFLSSEDVILSLRPKLEIWYMTPDEEPGYAIIQRPGPAQDGVADASIYESFPNTNYNYSPLTVAISGAGLEKYSLIRFHFGITPPSPPEGPGTGTPGYWKNHPKAWPVSSITIGGATYTKAQAIALMNMPVSGDKTYTMFDALVAAELNKLVGNDASCIADKISAAQIWMAANPVGSGVTADSLAWQLVGESLYKLLDAYNNGWLCAPPRY